MGLVSKWGGSFYSPQTAQKICDLYPIELIQCPVSPLDTRFITSGILPSLNKRGIEVHARSLFLQGLLLHEPQGYSSNMQPLKQFIDNWRAWLKDNNLSPLEACISFCNYQNNVDKFIIGVESSAQLKQIISCLFLLRGQINIPNFGVDEHLLNPSNWH